MQLKVNDDYDFHNFDEVSIPVGAIKSEAVVDTAVIMFLVSIPVGAIKSQVRNPDQIFQIVFQFR